MKQVISIHRPDLPTKALLPFKAAKGTMLDGDIVDLVVMPEATYRASERHTDLDEISAPGFPAIRTVLDKLLDEDPSQSVSSVRHVRRPGR